MIWVKCVNIYNAYLQYRLNNCKLDCKFIGQLLHILCVPGSILYIFLDFVIIQMIWFISTHDNKELYLSYTGIAACFPT